MTTLSIEQAKPFSLSEATENTAWLDGRQGIVDLTWRVGLLEQIRSYVGSTFISRSGLGEDAGGLLFGYRHYESVQVLAWRPISRGKDATEHFYLNPKEEQLLRKTIENAKNDASLKSMEVLGWFRSRTKGEPDLEEHDIKFHEKFFDRPSQFVMIIRPSNQRPADAAVYVRNRQDLFEPRNPTTRLSLKPGPIAVDVDRETLMGGDSIAGVLIEEAEVVTTSRFPWLQAVTMIIAASVVTVGLIWLLQWNSGRQDSAKKPVGLGFEISIDGNELKAKWNASSSLVQSADTAQLFLGEDRLQLSHSELAQGYLTIPMKSDSNSDTEISLKVGDQEEFAQLVASAR